MNITKQTLIEHFGIKPNAPALKEFTDTEYLTPMGVCTVLNKCGLLPDEQMRGLYIAANDTVERLLTPKGAAMSEHEYTTQRVRLEQLEPIVLDYNERIDAQRKALNAHKRLANYPQKAATLMQMEATLRDLNAELEPIQREYLPLKESVSAREKELPAWLASLLPKQEPETAPEPLQSEATE
ncbi:hypothetical protein QQ054_01035 [Oscillatoria amoena NRMC-F 0135]|nr:hypothetical protein [Oscillatoria amoena NRMC-F 0135]